MARNLGMTSPRLRDLARVADAFPPDQRWPQLSFEAHGYLAALPVAERAATAAQAANEGWGDRAVRKFATDYRQANAGFVDEDVETSQAVHIMRAWNRASPEARSYFNELQKLAGLGLVHEDIPDAL